MGTKHKLIKAPSFRGLSAASVSSARAKQANAYSNTRHEVMLRSALWRMGLRFRKNVRSLPGKPDIVFPRAHVVVFCDGDFWHGRNWQSRRKKLQQGANASYWVAKIASNIKRDRKNNRLLEKSGWHVIRVWETDILKDPIPVARLVQQVVQMYQGGTQ